MASRRRQQAEDAEADRPWPRPNRRSRRNITLGGDQFSRAVNWSVFGCRWQPPRLTRSCGN